MNLQWLMGPAIGSIIGYITNDIAVRMMFRPHREIRLFGRRVPFTPGLIPKERPRLARAIRDVLDQELLSREVLESALLSDDTLDKIGNAAEHAMIGLLAEERTPRTLLSGALEAEALTSFEAQAKRTAGIFLMEKILESGIEKTAAEAILAEVKTRMAGSPAALFSAFLDEKRTRSMEEKLSQTIREMLATHGPQAIGDMIDDVVRSSMDVPVGTLLQKHEGKLADARAFAVQQYAAIIRRGLPAALHTLDPGKIAEDKLNSLNVAETEALIMQVMKKELRVIVWLGALLGGIMGLANALVPMLF